MNIKFALRAVLLVTFSLPSAFMGTSHRNVFWPSSPHSSCPRWQNWRRWRRSTGE
jgi:hypothetical protein